MNKKDYPLASMDEISQWLFDNFGLLPGCCSSILGLQYNTARMVAEALWPPKEEYIRKDALLKWAKRRREVIAKEVVIQDGVRLGADAAFEELIDKINSL